MESVKELEASIRNRISELVHVLDDEMQDVEPRFSTYMAGRNQWAFDKFAFQCCLVETKVAELAADKQLEESVWLTHFQPYFVFYLDAHKLANDLVRCATSESLKLLIDRLLRENDTNIADCFPDHKLVDDEVKYREKLTELVSRVVDVVDRNLWFDAGQIQPFAWAL